jgi:hypothetical protein
MQRTRCVVAAVAWPVMWLMMEAQILYASTRKVVAEFRWLRQGSWYRMKDGYAIIREGWRR